MKKNIFGITIGAIITVILCLSAAVLFWLFVKYIEMYGLPDATAYIASVRGLV